MEEISKPNTYCKDIICSWKPRISLLKQKNKLFNNIMFVEQLNKLKDKKTSVNYFSSIINGKVNITTESADIIEELLRRFEKNI